MCSSSSRGGQTSSGSRGCSTSTATRRGIHIHHIFPRKWCEARGVPPGVYNSIVNKTAISYKANRKIGGNAPSAYLVQIQRDKAVQLDAAAMDAILRTHIIDPSLLRADDFDGFFRQRKAALLSQIEWATGKQAILTDEPTPEDAQDAEDGD